MSLITSKLFPATALNGQEDDCLNNRPLVYRQSDFLRSDHVFNHLRGIAFGVLMTIVDYFPQILKRIPPPENLSLTPASIGLWLFFEGPYVGPTEEIPFRGLLQTFLMQRTSGRVRLWKFDMHIAGVILASLFAFAHVTSFWTEAFWLALGQQIYAFALGILYAYWREKSGSLLAPVVGHNLSDGVEYALMFLMTWLWR